MALAACFYKGQAANLEKLVRIVLATWKTLVVWLCSLGSLSALLFAGVAGCDSLPQRTSDTGAASFNHLSAAQKSPGSPPAKLHGARGPLTVQQSKAILADLSRRGEDTGIFERHLAIEEAVAGSPLMVGNRTTLFEDGESTYVAMFKAIAAAKKHINVETYIIEDDEVGKRFSDALIAKQKQGVQVALMYDSVGSIATPKAFFQRLNNGGIKTLEFNPVNPLLAKKGWELNQRDHRKLLIVDGRTVFLGGINISSVYSSGLSGHRKGQTSKKSNGQDKLPWRDTHLMVEGPVAAEFQKHFMASWIKQKGSALPDKEYFPAQMAKGKEVVRAIASSADDEGGGQIYSTLVSAINSAETSIFLTNAYFAPDEHFMKALADAVARQVDVKIILPSKTDSELVFHAGRSYYAALLDSGVKIYERGEALLHAKTALIDGVWSTVGSTNLDWRSFLHNDEINAVILGAEFAQQMNKLFEKDLAASTQVTQETWAARSLLFRLKEQGARLWVYWL